MNRIVIDNFTFTNADSISANVFLSNSPIGESLQSDTFEFTIVSDGECYLVTSDNQDVYTSDDAQLLTAGVDISTLAYGTPVSFYQDNTLIGKFYVKEVTQIQSNQYEVSCISAVGLLSYIVHYGGVYGVSSTTTVTELIEEIVGDIDIEIDSVFDTMQIQGYLPKANARDNLRQVLFAVGGAILKDANGDLIITYNQPDTAKVITAANIYEGGSITKLSHATKVTLIEHSYFVGNNTTPTELFNNLSDLVGITNQEIVFDSPYYNLTAYDSNGNDITSSFIVESGSNYMIVGTASHTKARVTGKAYIHSQRQITRSTGVTSYEDSEVSVSGATLVSPLNSTNCIERLVSYYGSANEVSVDIKYDNEKSGDLISVPNLYGTGNIVGYIKTLDINVSNVNKASTKLAVNWSPNHLGNTYDKYLIIDSESLGGLSGTWIPEDEEGESLIGKEAYVVLFNGSNGGSGGYDGASGTNASGVATTSHLYYQNPSVPSDFIYENTYEPINAGAGGTGGAGGTAGASASKYNGVVLTLGNSYNVSLGAGGSGGSRNGGAGGTGGTTTFGSYTSNVHDLNGSYVNFVDNSIYCQPGESGIAGGNGGNGGTASRSNATPAYANPGAQGGNAGEYSGGEGSVGVVTLQTPASGTVASNWYCNVGGGGGGGASASSNGTTGGNADANPTEDAYTSVTIIATMKGGNGGAGANASQPTKAIHGNGGAGGCGGGGGGGAGASMSYSLNPYKEGVTERPWASGGFGGQGSAGGNGSDGFVIVYYSSEA